MNTNQRLDRMENALSAIALHLGIDLDDETPAKPAKAAKAPAKAADGEKIYRSKPGKAQAKAECEALAVKWDLKVAGGKRTFKSLSAKEQAAYRAEQKAIWARCPKTRTTKG